MKGKKKEKISTKMTFAEILRDYPGTAKIFVKHGLGCAMCPLASQESLEIGARAHGIDPVKLVAELNEFVKKAKKRS